MLHIRQATIDDAESIAQLNCAVHEIHAESRPEIFKPLVPDEELTALTRERLMDSSTYVFIAEVHAEPVGYVLTQVIERAENVFTYAQRHLLIDQMAVDPKYRSRSYGEQLMQRVFELARELNIRRVVLNVWRFNERAVAFYERSGFEMCEVRMEKYID